MLPEKGGRLRSEAEILESEVERYFVSQVKARGGWPMKLSIPGVRGLPDRICFMPKGRLLLCELKRPRGGRLHALQGYVHKKFAGLGFKVYRAHTLGGVDQVFEEHDAQA
jgi:hypothetical protein